MDPTTTSSTQTSTSVLPVQSLEQTLRDLHVDRDVQSSIENVPSQPAQLEDAHLAAGSSHAVPSLSSVRPVVLRFDYLSMAMEELGLTTSAAAVFKAARLAESATRQAQATPDSQAVLAPEAQQDDNDPPAFHAIIVKVDSLAAALLKLGITEVTATTLIDVVQQKQPSRYIEQDQNAEGGNRPLPLLSGPPSDFRVRPSESTLILNPPKLDAKTLERRRRVMALAKEAFPDGIPKR